MPRGHVSDGCSPLNAPAPNSRALIPTPPKSHNPCAGVLGAFHFDRRGRALFHLDSGAQIPIGSRALGVLGVLIERAGDLVPKDEIMEAVWPETVVEDANLTVHISTLRRVLDAGRLESSCIQTISGRGYSFVGGVMQDDTNAPSGVETREPRSVRTPPRLSIVVLPINN